MASIITKNSDLYLKAAILASGGRLTIPDSLLIKSRSVEFTRFDNAKDRCVVFTAKTNDNSEAVEQPLTQVKTTAVPTPEGEITPLCKSCTLLDGCPFGGKFKQGCYRYRPV